MSRRAPVYHVPSSDVTSARHRHDPRARFRCRCAGTRYGARRGSRGRRECDGAASRRRTREPLRPADPSAAPGRRSGQLARGWQTARPPSSTSPASRNCPSNSHGRDGKAPSRSADVIGRSFEAILHVAYDNGGSLLKFGGDALLLWFEGEGHAVRACRCGSPHATSVGRGRPHRVARCAGHAADGAGRALGALPFLRRRHDASRVADDRSRLESPGGDAARGRRGRDCRQRRDGRGDSSRVRRRARRAPACSWSEGPRAIRRRYR